MKAIPRYRIRPRFLILAAAAAALLVGCASNATPSSSGTAGQARC